MPAYVCVRVFVYIYIKNIHTCARARETGKWPKDFLELRVIAIKKPEAPIGVIVEHTVKIVARILRRTIVKKMRMYSEKMSFVLEEKKELRT